MSVSRRTVLSGAIGAALTAGLGYEHFARANAQQTVVASKRPVTALNTKPITIGYLPITDASALLNAYEQGIFAAHGVAAIRPVLFRSWESLAQAFSTGKIDLMHVLMPMAVQLKYAKKLPMQLLGWGHTNGSALTVANHITSIDQLAGTQIAIPYWWSVHNIVLQKLLRAHDITPVVRTRPSASARTAELLVMAPADMVAALDSGNVSAFTVADPFNTVATVKRAGKILRFFGDVWNHHACCVIAAHESLVTDLPLLNAVSDALVESQFWLDSHRDKAAGVLKGGKYLPQPEKAINAVFTRGAKAPVLTTEHAAWNGFSLGFAPHAYPSYTEALVNGMGETLIDGNADFLSGLAGPKVHQDLFTGSMTDAAERLRVHLGAAPGSSIFPTSFQRTEEIAP